MKINKGKITKGIAIIGLMVVIFNIAIMALQYPEQYILPFRYQLKNDLAKGDLVAIEYYNNNYIAKGKYLFGEDKADYLNLATVTSYDITEDGVLLHTNDGNGYFIER